MNVAELRAELIVCYFHLFWKVTVNFATSFLVYIYF